MEILGLNPIEMLNHWNDGLAELAGKMGMGKQQMVFYIIGAVLAVLIGLFASRIGVMLGVHAVLYGCVGYFAGYELFMWFRQIRLLPFSRMPEFVAYIVGGVFAVLLIALGIRAMTQSLLSFYAVFFAAGFYLTYCFTDSFSAPLKLLVPFAAGLLLAVLAACSNTLCILLHVLLSAAAYAFATVSFLGAALPKVALLQLGTNKNAIWIALGIAFVYFIIQLVVMPRNKMKKKAA